LRIHAHLEVMHVVDSLKDYFVRKVLVMKKKCPKVHQFDLLA